MSKYTFKCEHTDLYGNLKSTITVESDEETLYEVMQNIRDFLLACGFSKSLVDEYYED